MNEDSSKSTSSSCRMTRSELERLLKESEYGANELLFSAYFTRDQNGGGPPRCVVCQKLLGAHEEPSSSSSTTQPNPVGAYGFLPTPHQQPQPLPPAAPALGTIIETDYHGQDEPTRAEAPSMIAALADTPPPPELKENYEKEGVDVVLTSIFGVMMLVGMVLAGVAVILLISFFASGLIANVPPVAAAPAGVLLIAFVFTYNTYGTHAEFDRNQRIVFYRKFWLYWCCCNTTVEVPFEQLSSHVDFRAPQANFFWYFPKTQGSFESTWPSSGGANRIRYHHGS